jgi:hypothetical protein
MFSSGRAWKVENPMKPMQTPTGSAPSKASHAHAVGCVARPGTSRSRTGWGSGAPPPRGSRA